MIFLEHDERVCTPRARLGVRAIRWAIRQLRFKGATIAGLARQLGLRLVLLTLREAGVSACGK